VEVAHGDGLDGAAGEAEEDVEFEDRKATTALLVGGLGKGALVGASIGSLDGGTIDDFDGSTGEARVGATTAKGLGSGDSKGFLEAREGKPAAGLAVGAGGRIDLGVGVEAEEGLELADDLATGSAGSEGLEEKGPEGAPEGEDALAAVGAIVALGEQLGRKEGTEELFDLGEGGVAELLEAAAEGSEAGAPGGEEGGAHRAVCIPPY